MNAIDLIKQFEGLELTAYPDPGTGAEPWTIGYGSTCYEDGTPIKPGDTITEEQAEAMLRASVLAIHATLANTIPGWESLSAGQRIALISFAYNLGIGFYGSDGFASMTKMLDSRDWASAYHVFRLYCKADGKTLPGLVDRRNREAEIFLQDLSIDTPMSKNLSVPYLSQLDNRNRPHGTCNVTSVAMCLRFLHPTRNYGARPGSQLEDHLFRVLELKGKNRENPYDLEWLFHFFKVPDDFRPDAKWSDAKRHIDQGKPIIAHGYFTASGHIIVVRGYDQKGWWVNDPFGEWFTNGYDTNKTGENLYYSDRMMRECCGTDGDLWLHFVG